MSKNTSQNSNLKNSKRAHDLQNLAKLIKEDDNHILIAITPKQ